MKRYLGLEQKATDRTIKEWRESLSDEQRKRMNIPKNSIQDIRKDCNTLQIETTADIVNHFGNYFKPTNNERL